MYYFMVMIVDYVLWLQTDSIDNLNERSIKWLKVLSYQEDFLILYV